MNKLKKNKSIIILSLIIFLVIIMFLIIYIKNNNLIIKKYSNNYYSFNYDSSWKIKNKSKDNISLYHKNKSQLTMKIMQLSDEYKYYPIDDLIDDILFNIKEQNSNYNLLYKEKELITINGYDGYKILYENSDSQVMLITFRKNEQLLVFYYEAKNEYFDMLLDSVYNIIYSFDTIDEQVELSYELSIDNKDVKWDKNDEITSQLKTTENYEIADKNYLVNFSIASNFHIGQLDTESQYYNFDKLDKGRLTLYVNVLDKNIYQYLDKNSDTANIYSINKYYKEKFSDFEEYIQKVDDENNVYLYKNSYTVDSDKWEKIYVIYEIDINHIIVFNFEGYNTTIPKELINMTKVNSYKNYSSYVLNTIKDDTLLFELKKIVNSKEGKYISINLKMPSKYKELDALDNKFEHRKIALEYYDEIEDYKYEIHYKLVQNIDSQIKYLNDNYNTKYKKYGTYKELGSIGIKKVNDKDFIVYDGGYTDQFIPLNSGKETINFYVNNKILFYKLENDNSIFDEYLLIEIKAKGNNITDQMISELTNFDAEIKNLK